MSISDQDFNTAKEAMAAAGRSAGEAAGSWVADGNTSERALRRIIELWDDGDPEAPSAPEPFCGGTDGGAVVSPEEVIDRETELTSEELSPEEISELADAYEDAYCQGWQDEAERTVRGMLP